MKPSILLVLIIGFGSSLSALAQQYEHTLNYLDKRFANYNDSDLQTVRSTLVNTSVDNVINSLHANGGTLQDAENELDQHIDQAKSSMETDRQGYLSTHNGGEAMLQQIDSDSAPADASDDPWLKAYIKDHFFYVGYSEMKKQVIAAEQ